MSTVEMRAHCDKIKGYLIFGYFCYVSRSRSLAPRSVL